MATSAARFDACSPYTSPVKAVFFDFDGTLWDPEPHIFQCYQELFREYGCVLPSDLWSSVIGTIGFDLFTHLEEVAGIQVNRVRAADDIQQRCATLLSMVAIRPGIYSLLSAVDAAGLARGIVSNSPRSWIHRYAAQCAITDGWWTIRSADGDPRLAKPSPYLYQCALADLGVGAVEALAFEDSPSGVRAATAAGIRCIAVPGQMTVSLDLSAADLRFDSYESVDLRSLLHTWPGLASAPPPIRQLPKG